MLERNGIRFKVYIEITSCLHMIYAIAGLDI